MPKFIRGWVKMIAYCQRDSKGNINLDSSQGVRKWDGYHCYLLAPAGHFHNYTLWTPQKTKELAMYIGGKHNIHSGDPATGE